jgi:hypothetical protein
MGSLFGVDINPSLDPFSGSFGESKSLGTSGPLAGAEDPGYEVLAGIPIDKALTEKYSWPALYGAEKERKSERRQKKRTEAAAAEAARPKAKAQEGVIDYTKLQKTLKQMQGVKGKAISPDIMKSLLSGAITGQIQPAIAREERAMDRAIQQKQLDIEAERHKQALRQEKQTAEMGFAGDVLEVVGEITVLCTELNRQGLLDIQVIERANKYRRKHIGKEVYEGYLMWATPLVEVMKVSPLVSKIVCFFWKPLTYELASRGNKRKGSLLGKISYSILSRFSKVVYFFNQKEVPKWVAQ